MKSEEYRRNRHACFKLEYHLVVVTKYRHPVLVGELENRLIEIVYQVFEEYWKCKIIEVNTDMDHIHILFESSPQAQLSKLINNFKTVSSRLLRKEYAETLAPYYWKPYFWSQSYFICTISDRTESMVQQYIQNQKDG